MKKRIFAMIIAVVISLSMMTTVSAEGVHIIDDDNCITSSSIAEAESKAQDIENKYGYYMMFCTTNTIDTETNYEYAQAVYEKNTSSDKGLILLHNTTDSVYVVYATEEAEKLFTETVIEALGDAYNNTETYADGVMAYLSFAETIVASAPNSAETAGNNAQVEETTAVVSAENNLPLVVDNADLLTDDEESKLTSKLNTITEEHNANVVVLTVTDLEGKSAEAYADDYYDYNGYKESDGGVLVLFKPGEDGERKLHITTHGTAIKEFSDSTIEDILYAMKDLLVAEDYYNAFNLYADKCDEALKPATVHWVWIPICFAIAFVLSLIISKIVASSLRPVRKQQNATNYVRKGSMVVTNGQDVFMYRNVRRTEISRDDDDTSTHTSSSGETHGGGGISF